MKLFFFFSSRRRHTRCSRDWSSDVCSSDLDQPLTVWSAVAKEKGGSGPGRGGSSRGGASTARSEEHTSELQSRLHLVCRLLLEKKKKTRQLSRCSCNPSLPVQTGSAQARHG